MVLLYGTSAPLLVVLVILIKIINYWEINEEYWGENEILWCIIQTFIACLIPLGVERVLKWEKKICVN